MKKAKRVLSLILVITMILSLTTTAFGTVTITQIPLRVKEWAQSPGTNITIFTNNMGTFEVVDIGTDIISNDMLSFDPGTGVVSTDLAGCDTLRSYVTYNNGVTWETANTGECTSIKLDNKNFEIVYSDNSIFNVDASCTIYDSLKDNIIPFQSPADLSSYNLVLGEVEEGDYTVESWSTYQGVVADNKVTKYNTQDEVDIATGNISDAQEDLVLKPTEADLTAYNNALNAVNWIDYTVKTWTIYQTVVNNNIVTTSNTQSEVDEATQKIIDAQKNLLYFDDWLSYNTVVNSVNEIYYTVESWEAYQLIVTENAMTDENSSSQVNAAKAAILLAQQDLVEKTLGGANMTAYEEALARPKAEEYYTTSSWAYYKSVVDANIVTSANTQAEVDEATLKINMAYQSLVLKSSVSDLTAYNAALGAVVESDYTADSWKHYIDFTVNFNFVNESYTQEQVNTATQNIIDAQKNLVFVNKQYLDIAKFRFSELVETDYTPESWTLLTDMLRLDESTNAAMGVKYNQMMYCMDILVKLPGDLTEYHALLSRVNAEDYTAESWYDYLESLNDPKLHMIESNLNSEIAYAIETITTLQENLVLADVIDKTELNELKEIVANYVQNGYTTDSWNTLQNALGLPESTVEEVEAKITALQDGIDNLVFTSQVYLDDAVAKYRRLVESDYTEESWLPLQQVIDYTSDENGNIVKMPDNASTIIKAGEIESFISYLIKKPANIDEWSALIDSVGDESDYAVDSLRQYVETIVNLGVNEAAVDELQSAVDAKCEILVREQAKLIKLPPDFTEYNRLVNLVRTDYTPETWEIYASVMAENIVTEDNLISQVNRAVSNLIEAQNFLVKKTDFTKFNELINLNPDNYTEASWKVYSKSLSDIHISINSSQEEVDRAIIIITNQQRSLVLKADLTAYNTLLASVKQFDYTVDSWITYQIVVSNNVVNENSTKEAVNLAIANITNAQSKLVKKTADIPTGGGGRGTSQPSIPSLPPIVPVVPVADKIKLEFVVDNDKVVVPVKETVVLKQDIKGYIKGYTDKTFKPDNKVTRAETTQMLSNILETSGMLKPEIKDVRIDAWYAGAVGGVVNAGIMKGYGDNTFKPENNITRQEFAVTLVNMLDLSSMTIDTIKEFPDIENIYGKEAITTLASLGVLSGYPDGTFKPNNEITRAEMIVILNRLLGDKLQTVDKVETEIERIQREKIEEFEKSMKQKEEEVQKALESRKEQEKKRAEQELQKIKADYEAELNMIMKENSERAEKEAEERLKTAGLTDIRDSWAREEILRALNR